MTQIDVSLVVLIYTTVVVLLVVAGFLVKLLFDLSGLARSAQSATELIQNELEPTLKELQEVAASVKSITNTADEKFTSLKNTFFGAIEKTTCITNKLKSVLSGVARGISVGIKLFKK